jgi:hypothetical protein
MKNKKLDDQIRLAVYKMMNSVEAINKSVDDFPTAMAIAAGILDQAKEWNEERDKSMDKIEEIAKLYNISLSLEQLLLISEELDQMNLNEDNKENLSLVNLILRLLSKGDKQTIRIEGIEINNPMIFNAIKSVTESCIKVRFRHELKCQEFKEIAEIEKYKKLKEIIEGGEKFSREVHSIKNRSRNIYEVITGSCIPPKGRRGIERQIAAFIYDLIAEFGLSPKWDIYNGIKDKYDAIKGYFWKNENENWYKDEE